MGAAIPLGVWWCASSTAWLPRGHTGLDHVVIANLAAPLVIAALAVALVAARHPVRVWWLVIGGGLVLSAPVAARWWGW